MNYHQLAHVGGQMLPGANSFLFRVDPLAPRGANFFLLELTLMRWAGGGGGGGGGGQK